MHLVNDLRPVSLLGHIYKPNVTELCKEWAWVVTDASRVPKPWNKMYHENSGQDDVGNGLWIELVVENGEHVYNHSMKIKCKRVVP